MSRALKKIVPVVTILATLGCRSEMNVTTASPNESDSESYAYLVATTAEVPTCTAKRVGILVYVKSENTFKSCDGTSWTEVSLKGDTGASGVSRDSGSGSSTLGTAASLNVGTSASNLVQLDSSGKLPAIDGSALTNVSTSPMVITAVHSDASVNATDTQRLYLADGTTTLTLPSTAKAGSTTFFKNVGSGIIYLNPAGAVFEGSVALFPIAPGGVAAITSDGTSWYLIQSQGAVGRCGDTAINNCYDTDKAKEFLNAGYAVTQSGKLLQAYTTGLGNKIWKENGGSRLLEANGLDGWQKNLNPNGKGRTTTDFTAYAVIGGRVCPPNVYLDDANKFSTGLCLYYDYGNAPQMLDQDGTDAILGLVAWNTYNGGVAKWFVGNIKSCGDRGMRLPTLFEAHVGYPDATPDSVDGNPQYAGILGVPSNNGWTWTATAKTNGVTWYGIWNSDSHNVSFGYNNATRSLRCVIPGA